MAEQQQGVRRSDWLLAALLLVLLEAEVLAYGVDGGDEAAALLFWAVIAASVTVRRRFPLAFALFICTSIYVRGSLGFTPLDAVVFPMVTLLAMFGAGAYSPTLPLAMRNAGLAMGAYVVQSLLLAQNGDGLAGAPAAIWFGALGLVATAAATGVTLRDRSETLVRLRRRLEEAPSEQEEVALALELERTRIAGELAMTVNSTVERMRSELRRARDLAATAPARAVPLIEAISTLSRGALAEMRSMLGLLRAEAEASDEAPLDPDEARRRHLIPGWVRAQTAPLLVFGYGVVAALLATAEPAPMFGTAPLGVRIIGEACLALSLLPRRRRPLLTAALVTAVILLRTHAIDDPSDINLAVIVAAFSAGAYGRTRLEVVASAAVIAASGVVSPILGGLDVTLSSLSYAIFTVGASTGLGYAWRHRIAQADELRELERAEQRRRRVAIERAVEKQRVRVARELHDLVGNGLTAIVLQSAVATRCLDRDPEQARSALSAIDDAGAEVSEELDELLETLHVDRNSEPRALGSLSALLESQRQRWPDRRIELSVSGDVDRVPDGVSASAYRIVQEALTNASKHGAAGRGVRVAIARDEDALEIDVTNSMPTNGSRPLATSGAGGNGSGLGIVGMRERVTAHGGHLDVGAAETGIWRVRAEFPLTAAGSTEIPR